MDWVFKASSSWELTELEREELDVLVMEKNQNMEDLSVDCGMLGDWDKWKEQTPPSPSPSPCGSSKRPRGNGNEQQVSCLVDGCKADLSSCRDYHRRHRVCEAHSKTPVVAIGGKDQRFCQQCSRFHSVGEFDEVKRSCRKRLDGHNRRRRKPKSSMYMNNYDTFFTTHHRGTKLLRFGGSPAYTGTSALSWPHREKPKQQFHVSVVQPSSLTSREKKFPFLLGPDHTNASSSAHHLVGQTSVQPPKGGALSLLSKHTNTIQHPSTPNPINFNFNHHVDHLPLTNVPGSNNHYIGMIHFRTEGSLLENEAPQALFFSWGELEL